MVQEASEVYAPSNPESMKHCSKQAHCKRPSPVTQSSPGSHEALQSICTHADAAIVAWKQACEGRVQQAPCVQACLRHKPAFATLARVCAAVWAAQLRQHGLLMACLCHVCCAARQQAKGVRPGGRRACAKLHFHDHVCRQKSARGRVQHRYLPRSRRPCSSWHTWGVE